MATLYQETLENREPLAGGDQLLVQGAMVPATKAGETAPAPTTTAGPAPDQPEEGKEE